ncbi:Histone deacetylase hda1 [Arachnomyces sp. PD_36]|nr:Histone deacetylase hda1 [Arachnomyces sp. PD_36]
MEGDEDTTMGGTGPPKSIPIGSGRPSSASPVKPSGASLPVNGSQAAPIPSPSFEQSHKEPAPLPSSHQQHPTQENTTPPTPAAALKSAAANSDEKSSTDNDAEDSLMEEDSDFDDEEITMMRGLTVSSQVTGLCYDTRMRYHCEVRPTADVHPEDPRRIYHIYKALCRAGLFDDPELSSRPLVDNPMRRIYIRDATKEEICLIHTSEHYDFVKSTQEMSDEELIALEESRDSIYFNGLTFLSSVLSAGGAIETCRAVVSGEVKNAIAVIRPPGHHAEVDKTMGFCLFNNVCVAAKACQTEFKDTCRKILILDWDVHHGNGVQKAFYEDPNVLYISLHVYQDGRFYPGGKDGDMDCCGEGPGVGKNVNIPWPCQGMGDGDYMYAFQQVIMPIAYEFDPDLVIISAGFDAAVGDDLGGCFVTPACYAHMTHMLMNLAGGKLAVCLEGGYNFRSISKSALAVTRTLMGETPDRLPPTAPGEDAVKTVRRVAMIHSKHWQCMYPKGPQEHVWTNRVHDIIRQYQSKQLFNEFKLTNLFVYRNKISTSFQDQVLASSNYDQERPLLVIFHDPPELMGVPHPVTNKLESHNCWLADVVKDYIEWAVGKGFGVIDVNVPTHTTDKETPGPGQYEDEDQNLVKDTEELAGYLWENYIEPNSATEIFFLGIGDAFYGIANLLMNRDTIYNRLTGVISYVGKNPVRAISSNNDPNLSRWYKSNSLVFVSANHGVWSGPDGFRKPSKRYGTLHKSSKIGLSEMLVQHKSDVFDWILQRVGVEESESGSGEGGEGGARAGGGGGGVARGAGERDGMITSVD